MCIIRTKLKYRQYNDKIKKTKLINAISLLLHLILFYLRLSPPYLFCPLISAVHMSLPLCPY